MRPGVNAAPNADETSAINVIRGHYSERQMLNARVLELEAIEDGANT
jgi:hypothetical protein